MASPDSDADEREESLAFDFDDGEHDSLPIREIYGSKENIERIGSPRERADETKIRYYFYPTWRSQFWHLIGFFLLCVLSIVVSHYIPALVVAGSLFSIGDTTLYLHLPVLTLLPGAMLGKILINIYDAKYIVDERGVEAQIGLVSLNLRQPRLAWEDIRGVEANQNLWERMIGIGTVLVGSAMTDDVEIVMAGVANPRAVQLLLHEERDRRLRELQGQSNIRAVRAVRE